MPDLPSLVDFAISSMERTGAPKFLISNVSEPDLDVLGDLSEKFKGEYHIFIDSGRVDAERTSPGARYGVMVRPYAEGGE
jgi:hypothetical protein